MNLNTARGYMVSRLSEIQLAELHGEEKKAGHNFMSSMIKSRFFLPAIGDCPNEVSGKAEVVVTAIYEKERAYYKARHRGCCFPLDDGRYTRSDVNCPENADIEVIHAMDKKIRDQEVDFPVLPTANMRGRLRSEVEA